MDVSRKLVKPAMRRLGAELVRQFKLFARAIRDVLHGIVRAFDQFSLALGSAGAVTLQAHRVSERQLARLLIQSGYRPLWAQAHARDTLGRYTSRTGASNHSMGLRQHSPLAARLKWAYAYRMPFPQGVEADGRWQE
jgi:hypothetical protein